MGIKLEHCGIKPSTLSVSSPSSIEYKNVARFVGKGRFFFHLQKLIFLPLLSNRLKHLYQNYKIVLNTVYFQSIRFNNAYTNNCFQMYAYATGNTLIEGS